MNTSSHAANGALSGRLAEPMAHVATALAKGAAKAGIKSVRKKASSMYHRGLGQVGAITDGTIGYVRENPIKTVLLAVGLGALIGFLLMRRS